MGKNNENKVIQRQVVECKHRGKELWEDQRSDGMKA
jgi:hypothetical protein